MADEAASSDEEPEHGFSVIEDLASLRALMHPLRMRAYVEAVKGPVSAKDLAERLEVPLPRISYHLRALAAAGMLRVASRTPRRGAVETHYRAVATLDVSHAAMTGGDPVAYSAWGEVIWRLLDEDVLHAVETREAAAAPDFMLGRAHFVVDDAGRRRLWQEMLDIYDRLARLEEELRVEPGPGTHELNVLLVDYEGGRAGGRNGPVFHAPDPEERETIPPQ